MRGKRVAECIYIFINSAEVWDQGVLKRPLGHFYGTNSRTGQQNLKERGMSGSYWAESQIFSLASFDVLLLGSSLVISPSACRLCSVEPLADMGFHLPGRASDPDGVLRAESLEDCHRSFRRPSHPRTGVYFLLHHFRREICSQDTLPVALLVQLSYLPLCRCFCGK